MPLNDFAEITVNVSADKASREGFGVPLIVSHSAAWAERTRTYTALSGVAVDFAAGTPEHAAASALFAQDPKPSSIMIGRANGAKPTQRYKITPTAANARDYIVEIGGTEVKFTSDANATVAEICTGLHTAINLGTATHGFTSVDGTSYITITQGTAGAWQRVRIMDINLLAIEQNHDDPAGLSGELDAIKTENGSFFGLVTMFNSKDYVVAVAEWAEANEKLYVVDTQDTPCLTVAVGSATDVMKAIADLTYMWTSVIYNPDNKAAAGAAWQGRCLTYDPGSETWRGKTLAGVATGSDGLGHIFTATHITNLRAKYGNFYERVLGINVTQDGKVAGNEWIDVVRFRAWLKSASASNIYGAMQRLPKVSFTDGGVAIIQAAQMEILDQGVKVGGLSNNPAPVVTVPKVSTVSSADKQARTLPNVTWVAYLAGAIHKVRVTGTVIV